MSAALWITLKVVAFTVAAVSALFLGLFCALCYTLAKIEIECGHTVEEGE